MKPEEGLAGTLVTWIRLAMVKKFSNSLHGRKELNDAVFEVCLSANIRERTEVTKIYERKSEEKNPQDKEMV